MSTLPSMILTRHPDAQPGGPQPGNHVGNNLKFIGYWLGSSMPKRLGVQVRPEPVLPDPYLFVDETWDAAERAAVVAHLRAGRPWEQWRGESWCRFTCGEREMGSQDHTDGLYVWPQGFVHYVLDHGVKPAQEFIDYVLSRPV